MCVLGTERRPSDLTFEHDRTQTPPVTVLCIPVATEDFRSNVVRGTDGRVGHNSAGLSPIVDHASVADSQIDLVQVDRVPVGGFAGFALQELCIVRVVM